MKSRVLSCALVVGGAIVFSGLSVHGVPAQDPGKVPPKGDAVAKVEQPRQPVLVAAQWEYTANWVCKDAGESSTGYFTRLTVGLNSMGKERWELVSLTLLPQPQGNQLARCFATTFKR